MNKSWSLLCLNNEVVILIHYKSTSSLLLLPSTHFIPSNFAFLLPLTRKYSLQYRGLCMENETYPYINHYIALRNVTSTPKAVQDCKKKFRFKLLNLHNCIQKRAHQKNTPKKKGDSQSENDSDSTSSGIDSDSTSSGIDSDSTSSGTDFPSTSTRISSPTIISSTGASTSSKSITSTSTSKKSVTSTSTSKKSVTSTSTSKKSITSTSTSKKSITSTSTSSKSITSTSTSPKSIPSTSLSSKSVTITISSTRTSTSTKVSSTSIPNSTPSPIQIQAIGLIGLTNDVEWVAQIAVGTPPQPFLISIDTASADLWIPSTKCTRCGKSRLFDPKKSSTFTAINSRFQIQYADGSSSTGLVEQFMVDVIDGIMGLGYDSLAAAAGTSTPLSNMLNQGLIPRAVFSVQLRPARIQSSYGGEFTFGGVDTSLFTGPITYTSVTQQLYWQISIDGVEMNEQVISGSQQVIVDTGTSLMVLGTDVVNNIIRKVKGRYDSSTGTWQVPCNIASGSNAVKIAIRINGVAWTINPLDLVREQVSRSNKFCYSGIVSTDENVWILGGVFLKNVYVVFDRENNRVGFATPVYS
ncbi:853_t:CDS:2 [Acaulospora morrowiae]|uniref:853_t:CDS:1 n=1 Tax=Acaulospora morrowiae TaxID=94023 RepID=A0A9N8VEW6_9GLOM|nr:853_t:CDS:2 [Acaulospora morrowiae]